MRRYVSVAAVVAAVAVVLGVTAAFARGWDVTGYPNELSRVDLNGYVIQTSYTLGANTDNTFKQTYFAGGKFRAKCVSGPFAPCEGAGNYTAMPVGHKQLMVTWYLDDGTLIDVFVFNFESHVVSDVAPGAVAPAVPGSLGTVTILKSGSARIP